MVHNSRIKRISLAVCLAMMPFAANAAGLGKLTVFSGLGEPLNAEIELAASKEELSSISAKIAPSDTYAEQGLDRPSVLGLLKVELGKQASGAPVIKLTTSDPVNDPFLDMLIQVEWSSGRLLREYTALLDPPGYGDQKAAIAPPAPSAPVAAPAVPGAASQPARSAQKSGKMRKAPSTAPATSKAETAVPAEQVPAGEGYTTRSGDTLRSVARQMQVEGVSLEQMLVGLYRTNKDAFIDSNMNRMKTGQIMRAPAPEELQGISQQEAIKEIHVHSSDWHAYRQKLAGEVAAAPTEEGGAQGQSASGKITAPAEDKAAHAPAGPRDVVKLSKSDTSGKVGGPETPTSKVDKAAAAKEDAAALDKAKHEADERIAALEKQIQDMQKLLQVKNQALSDLQKGAPAPAPQVTPPAPEVKKPEPVAAPKPETASPAPAQPAPAPAAETKPAEPPKPEAPAEDAAKKPKRHKPAPVVAPEPPAEPDLLEDPMLLGGVGGTLVALLGAGWFYLRNKRRKGLDSFEQGILTTSGLKPNTVFGNTSGGMVDTGDTSFLTDLSQGSGGMIDTNDVDPIAEAEVYMAYGRDVQAEEILKDAIGKEPKRYELHQKLLEIYANRKDTASFETLAGELYATLGATDPTWQKFAAMGHELEPDNPLYQGDADVNAPVATDTTATQALESSDFNDTAQDMSLDFTAMADSGTAESSVADETPIEPVIGDNSLDFDLGASGQVEPFTSEEVTEASAEEAALPELELPTEAAVPLVPEEESLEASSDAGLDFSFDLPEPASEDNVQLDATDLGMDAALQADMQEPAGLEPLPELSESETVAEVPAEVEEISFDLPELSVESQESAVSPAEVSAESVDVPLELPELHEEVEPQLQVAEPSIELPMSEEPAIEFPVEADLESATIETAPEMTATEAAPAGLELPSLEMESPTPDMEKTMIFQAPVEGVAAEEIVFDSEPEESAALDFSFDADVGEAQPETAEAAQAIPSALPDLDLTGISLDLDVPEIKIDTDTSSEPELSETGPAETEVPSEVVEEITLAGSESADVDTKLDLVAAYMDMGDTEGARELLDEVLREGGPQQRDRAQKLLDGLG